MAGPREIALGIASVLGKPGLPNPLIVSFRGQTLQKAASIVLAIVAECVDAELAVDKIELDADLAHMIAAHDYDGPIRLVASDSLASEIRVFADP